MPITSAFLKLSITDEAHVLTPPSSNSTCKERKPTNCSTGGQSTLNPLVKSYKKTFSRYAEIDVTDQPTDYSVRYAENDLEESELEEIISTEFSEDTIKTYCTENTPYETPFLASSLSTASSSMCGTKPTPVAAAPPSPPIKNLNKNKKSQESYNSGLITPEDPVNYCEEGTPGVFSSFGSLNSLKIDDETEVDDSRRIISLKIEEDPPKIKSELSSIIKCDNKYSTNTETSSSHNNSNSNSNKVVKFEEVVNYAEETPLMFSRCSSLASLDSVEQHSIHDDRSSIISDFSRFTSGLVSPSELPDSPTQTLPPSPKSKRKYLHHRFSARLKIKYEAQLLEEGHLEVDGVFEDTITKFKMESTPIEFSTATSLSNLTIDEFEEEEEANRPVVNLGASITTVKDENINNSINEVLSEEDEEEEVEDEALLVACINDGIQMNRCTNSDIHVKTEEIPIEKQQKLDRDSDQIKEELIEETAENQIDSNNCNSDNNDVNNHFIMSDCDNSSSSDEDRDNALLANCINSVNLVDTKQPSSQDEIINRNVVKYEIDRLSVYDEDEDDVDEEEEDLLKQCILAGIPKSFHEEEEAENTNKEEKDIVCDLDESTELTEVEQDLLKQCILNGVPKHIAKEDQIDFNTDLTDVEQKLLKKCISSAIPKRYVQLAQI